MRTRAAVLLLAVLADALASCSPGANGAAAGPPFPVFPMTLEITGEHEGGEPLATLAPDGTMTVVKRHFVAHLYPDRLVGPDGRPLVWVSPGGDVVIDPRAPAGHFDARGAIVSPQGDVIFVDDAGIPSWSEPRGGLPSLPARFRPFSPAARRTAEAVFIVTMMLMWERGLPS